MNENTINNDVTLPPERLKTALGRIDQYELVRELGGGGFGTVFLAHDTDSGLDYAVKGLPPLVRNNKEELENIRRNFLLVSRLDHTHITAPVLLQVVKSAVYADRATEEKFRVWSGDFLTVMKFAPGVTLSRWRKQFPEGKVPSAKALEIVRQIADALDYAHGEKIIHRDIKPSNVMVETKPNGALVARVLDFGLAAEIRSSMGRVSREVTDTSGTRPYMAPEQWRGRKQTAATDQYALAVLTTELLTGEVPFSSIFETGDPVLMKNVVCTEQSELSSTLSQPLRQALLRALSKEPEARFSTCLDFVAALEEQKITDSSPRSAGSSTKPVQEPSAYQAEGLYKVVDLSNGSIDNLMDVPAGGWTDEYKTSKLVLRRIEPRTFDMGESLSWFEKILGAPGDKRHRVVLTKPYYMGVFETTQGQWHRIMGANPSHFDGDDRRPVENVSYEDIRGSVDGARWPMSAAVDAESFLGQLRDKTRCYGFDLPTEGQWEYACRAGTRGEFAGELDAMGWFESNSGNQTHEVGRKMPNKWGLYDMHGNVWEWCLDWYGAYDGDATDPKGPASGEIRVGRGGSWCSIARLCRSAGRDGYWPGNRISNLGFRLGCSAGPSE